MAWVSGAAVPLVVLAQTAAGDGIPTWAFFATSGGLVAVMTLVFRAFLLRSERRLADAGASKTEAEALEIQERVRSALMEEVETQMQYTRREAEHARTMEAAAQAELAVAQAEVAKMVLEHQRDREAWRDERHAMVNDHRAAIEAKNIEIFELRAQIGDLQEKVRTMEIRLGYAEGRRDSDEETAARMAVLEDRADRSETRADRAKDRADVAREVAVEQEHRNDDTPGHA